MKPGDIELLKQIAEFEDSTDQEHDWPIGWCWRDVRISEELAREIARVLNGRSQDVRDAVRVARLTPQVGVEKAVKLLLNK
jgi:hypothetical protein